MLGTGVWRGSNFGQCSVHKYIPKVIKIKRGKARGDIMILVKGAMFNKFIFWVKPLGLDIPISSKDLTDLQSLYY